MLYKNAVTSFFRFVTIHAFDRLIDGQWTDRQTERQTDRKAFAIPYVALHAVAR